MTIIILGQSMNSDVYRNIDHGKISDVQGILCFYCKYSNDK